MSLPNAEVTAATSVPAGSFTPPPAPGSTAAPTPIADLPAFCRVQITSHPTSDSDVMIEVWLPDASWNGKYLQVGNGGFAGAIPYSSIAAGLRRGYATAGTDDGHEAGTYDASWTIGHPEKVVDFGYRALKETTDKSKAVIEAFYTSGPNHSYFQGCSDGGREAMQEAQRYPDDFDGIVAGAPASYWTRYFAEKIWAEQALFAQPDSFIPTSKLPAIQSAVIAACDGSDGTEDGIVGDPPRCHFNPEVLLCTGAETDSCLNEDQAVALLKIIGGPVNASGVEVSPGFYPSAAAYATNGWGQWLDGPPATDLDFLGGNGFYGTFVHQDPNWDFHTFNVDTDVALADQKYANVINATNPDLGPFKAHGGKLIQYHGWSDAAIPPVDSPLYYNSVIEAMGGSVQSVQDFHRLFMVPGMLHCSGGPGANAFGNSVAVPQDPEHDVLRALEAWVENNVAPDRITATKYNNDDPTKGVAFTRPLCPYPQVARYDGSGDRNDASNWACVDEPLVDTSHILPPVPSEAASAALH